MPWMALWITPGPAIQLPSKKSKMNFKDGKIEAEVVEGCHDLEEGSYNVMHNKISLISPATSANRKDTSHDIVLSIVGTTQAEAKHILCRYMTTTIKRNQSKLHRQLPIATTLNRKPKTGSMEWLQMVTK